MVFAAQQQNMKVLKNIKDQDSIDHVNVVAGNFLIP